MNDPSLREPQEKREELKQEQARRRLCDYCNCRAAVLYCRADSAKLCFSCDREVHSTNQLFSKHSRSQLCDGCDASPASIFCETEQSVLCTNCDWENHSQGNLYLSPLHNRRPIESFTGCPSVSELFAIIGFDDLDHKALFFNDENRNDCRVNGVDGDGLSDLFAWETQDFVSIDDLIISSDSGHSFQALGVPPLPKNRNAACGQHKEEMLCQLRQLAKFEPNLKYEIPDFEPMVGFQSLEPEPNVWPANLHTGSDYDTKPISIPSNEANALKWFGDSGEAANQLPSTLLRNLIEESSVAPDRYLDFGGRQNNVSGDEGQSQHPNANTSETLSFLPKVGVVHELNSQERDSAISRYKEKRKTRRYDKHIRYESRKVRAESRTRIKGRFAKIDHLDTESQTAASS